MNTPTPGYREMVELLFPKKGPRYHWPDSESIFTVAIREITQLRKTLCAQSTNLAEALKLKNDALERVALKKNELHKQNRTIIDLKACAEAELLRLTKENNNLREELAKLKPPEPKFRVGQVVHALTGKSAGKITKREHNPDVEWLGEGWCYWLENYATWWHESRLRALTSDER